MAYLVISTCVPESTRTLPRSRSGMRSRSQGDKDSFQRQSNNEETEMRSKCAQRLVQTALLCSYRSAFIENRMPIMCTSGREFCIWEGRRCTLITRMSPRPKGLMRIRYLRGGGVQGTPGSSHHLKNEHY